MDAGSHGLLPVFAKFPKDMWQACTLVDDYAYSAHSVTSERGSHFLTFAPVFDFESLRQACTFVDGYAYLASSECRQHFLSFAPVSQI